MSRKDTLSNVSNWKHLPTVVEEMAAELGLTTDQVVQLLKQVELTETGCFVTANARRKFETGRITIDDYQKVFERQHGLLVKNRS